MAGFEGLLTPQSTEGTKTVDGKKVSSDSSSTPKSGPSLFDSMLSQLGAGTTTIDGETTQGEGAKGTSSQTNQNPSQVNTTNKSESNTPTGVKTTTNGTSLFDKMVSESAQQGGQNTNVDSADVQKTQQKTSTPLGTPQTSNNIKTTDAAQTEVLKSVNTGATETKNLGDGKVDTSLVKNVSPQVNKNLSADTATQTKEKGIQTSSSNNLSSTINTKIKTVNENPVSMQEKAQVKTAEVNNTNKQETTTPTTGLKVEQTTKDKNLAVDVKNTNNVVAKQSTPKELEQKTLETVKESNTKDTINRQVNSTATISQNKNTEQAVSKGTSSSNPQESLTPKTNISEPINKQVKSDALNNTSSKSLSSDKTAVSSNPTNKISVSETNIPKDKTTSSLVPSSNELSSSKSSQKVVSAIPVEQSVNSITGNTKNNTLSKEEGEVKKSLADNLISTATATALANKNAQTTDNTSGVVKPQENKITTPLTNPNITQDNKVLASSGETIKAQIIDVNVAEQTVDTLDKKQEIKTTEQNVIDRKNLTKDLEVKNIEQRDQLSSLENDKIEKSAAASSATVTSATNSNSTTSNQELASQLANIRETAKGEVTAITDSNTKSTLQNVTSKEEKLLDKAKKDNTPESLLDKMVKDSKTTDTSVVDDSLGTKDQFVQKDLPLFATAGYLHDQKRRNDIANMMKKYEGVQEAQNAKGVSDIKKSAQTLELNATEAEVVKEVVQKEEARVQNTREDMLKRLAFDNNVGKKLHNNNVQLKESESIVSKATNLTNTTEEKVVEIAVSNEATQTIENRIIGARQTLRTMMSDVARQMAENYRPPLTAFRINLNPSGLGHIAVMLKAEQNNGISISLNMSNASTHDTLVDNQAALRAALTRNFENTTSFNLNFGMQQDTNNQSNQNQSGNSNQNNNNSSDRIISANNPNQESTEEVIEQQANYM